MVTDFEDYKIVEASIQFKKDGETLPAVKFGCIGTMDGESNTEEVIKKCEGKVIKKITRVTDMAVSITSHLEPAVSRDIAGMSNKGLKEGVYAYGTNSFCNPFIFTAKILDMEGKIKYIAFPNVANAKGLTLKVDNEATEIELKDLEFSALADSENNFYYEAYEEELTDDEVKQKWLTSFSTELVKVSTAQGE